MKQGKRNHNWQSVSFEKKNRISWTRLENFKKIFTETKNIQMQLLNSDY